MLVAVLVEFLQLRELRVQLLQLLLVGHFLVLKCHLDKCQQLDVRYRQLVSDEVSLYSVLLVPCLMHSQKVRDVSGQCFIPVLLLSCEVFLKKNLVESGNNVSEVL